MLAAVMIAGVSPITAFASTKVSTIRLTVTSTVEAGMFLDEIGYQTVKVETDTPGVKVETASIEAAGTSQKAIKVGDEVKVRVELSSTGDYYFKSPSIKITGATYKSKSNSSEDGVTVTFALKPVKGSFSMPDEADWYDTNSALGKAKWVAPDNTSGYYDLVLYRDDKKVVTVNDFFGTSYNFYPWMTKEGDYYFKVRTAKHAISGAVASDYLESGTQYIDQRHVSDGSGQDIPQGGGSSGGKAGWIKTGAYWYYYFPDGSMKKNGWEKVSGKWYLFNATGEMLTGWQSTGGQYYYLDAVNGDMKTGWIKTNDGKWYFLNTGVSGIEGAMIKSQWIESGGYRYFLTDTGAMATGWCKINNKFYYFNPKEGGPQGSMLKNTYVDTFYVGPDGAWIENY